MTQTKTSSPTAPQATSHARISPANPRSVGVPAHLPPPHSLTASLPHCLRPRNSQVTTRNSPNAFTLTEMLVVMAIVVLIAALALPAFNVLSGTRSIEAATNLASAAIAQVRAEAMSRQQTCGLAIYFDQEKQQTALAQVGFAQKWTPNTNYQRGDMVYRDEAVAPSPTARYYWICHTNHTSDSGAPAEGAPTTNAAANPVQMSYNVSTGGSGKWAHFDPTTVSSPDRPNLAASSYISLLPESEVIYLPKGISAQVLNSAIVKTGGNAYATDRYTTVGVIFFAADGQLAGAPSWGILFSPDDSPAPQGPVNASTDDSGPTGARIRSSRLGTAIRFNTDGTSNIRTSQTLYSKNLSYNLDPVAVSPNPPTTYCTPLTSGLGIILYDRQAYQSQNFPQWDAQLMDQQYSTSPYVAADNWLDANGTVLLINRYTGTLLKSE